MGAGGLSLAVAASPFAVGAPLFAAISSFAGFGTATSYCGATNGGGQCWANNVTTGFGLGMGFLRGAGTGAGIFGLLTGGARLLER